MSKFYLIDYPERRAVPEEEARGWCMDALANGDIEGGPCEPTDSLLRKLADTGAITWHGESREVKEMRPIVEEDTAAQEWLAKWRASYPDANPEDYDAQF